MAGRLAPGRGLGAAPRRRGGLVGLQVANTVPAGSGRRGNGLALDNVRQRLALLHDVQGRFQSALVNGVFQVRLEIPVLIVDDELLARSRLRTLLSECSEPRVDVVGEAGNAVQAMEQIQRTGCDLVLLDIHMPGVDGMALAKTLRELAAPPAVVFITAHAEHAVQAFELEAVDYLTKPVRRERLQQALQKVQRLR
eukprot:gene34913-57776_t